MTHELTKSENQAGDGFDEAAADPTASPFRGTGIRFKDGDYFAFSDRINVDGKSYAVLNRLQGWQKLQEGCSPEYLIKKRGELRPARPHVDAENWPLNFNGKPEHPWKLTTYLHLIDAETGEFLTFWTNTIGGNIAVGQLTDQISFMRQARPNMIPVVALEARDMPTQYGGTKPRPHFQILGWRERAGPEQNEPLKIAPTSLIEHVEKELAEAKKPAETAAKKPPKVTKIGGSFKEPTLAEILDDDLPEDLK